MPYAYAYELYGRILPYAYDCMAAFLPYVYELYEWPKINLPYAYG